jgi:hypothetical protein
VLHARRGQHQGRRRRRERRHADGVEVPAAVELHGASTENEQAADRQDEAEGRERDRRVDPFGQEPHVARIGRQRPLL